MESFLVQQGFLPMVILMTTKMALHPKEERRIILNVSVQRKQTRELWMKLIYTSRRIHLSRLRKLKNILYFVKGMFDTTLHCHHLHLLSVCSVEEDKFLNLQERGSPTTTLRPYFFFVLMILRELSWMILFDLYGSYFLLSLNYKNYFSSQLLFSINILHFIFPSAGHQSS